MNWTKVIGASVLAVCLVGSMVYAADNAGPAAPAKGKWLQNGGALKGQGGPLQGPMARPLMEIRKLGFIVWALNQFPDVREVVKAHKAKLDEFRAELQTLQQSVREKLKNAANRDERLAIIEQAKIDTGAVLTKVVDEAVAHHRKIADLVEQHKADIVTKAVERIYQRGRRPGGMKAGDAPGPGEADTPDELVAPIGLDLGE